MPKKTAKAKTAKVSGGRAVASAATAEKPKGDFLIVRVSRDLRRGQSVTILEFAESEDKARKWVDALTDASPAFVAIMQKKMLLERKPKMVVTELTPA